jgi:hypothetical protein
MEITSKILSKLPIYFPLEVGPRYWRQFRDGRAKHVCEKMAEDMTIVQPNMVLTLGILVLAHLVERFPSWISL